MTVVDRCLDTPTAGIGRIERRPMVNKDILGVVEPPPSRHGRGIPSPGAAIRWMPTDIGERDRSGNYDVDVARGLRVGVAATPIGAPCSHWPAEAEREIGLQSNRQITRDRFSLSWPKPMCPQQAARQS